MKELRPGRRNVLSNLERDSQHNLASWVAEQRGSFKSQMESPFNTTIYSLASLIVRKSHLTSLGLNFLICKMRQMILPEKVTIT